MLSLRKILGAQNTRSGRPQPSREAQEALGQTHQSIRPAASEELDFVRLLRQQETTFTQESESQSAGHERRRIEFESFINEIDSEFAAAQNDHERRFDRLAQEQEATHSKHRSQHDIDSSKAERARQDIFAESQLLKDQQLSDTRRHWEEKFLETRKILENVLQDTSDELDPIIDALSERSEQFFVEQQKGRDAIVENLLAEFNIQQPSIEPIDTHNEPHPSHLPPVPPPQDSMTATNVLGTNGGSESAISIVLCGLREAIPDDLQPSGHKETSQTDTRPPVSLPSSSTTSPGSSITRVESWVVISSGTTNSDSSSSTSQDITSTEGKDNVTTTPPESAYMNPSVALAQNSPTHLEKLSEVQAGHQLAFERAEQERFAALSQFDALFTERIATHCAQFDSMLDSYSKFFSLTEHTRTAEEEKREREVATAEARRDQISDGVLRKLRDDYKFATLAESAWDQDQRRHIIQSKAKVLTMGTAEQKKRFEEAFLGWESSLKLLQPLACRLPGHATLINNATENNCLQSFFTSLLKQGRKDTAAPPASRASYNLFVEATVDLTQEPSIFAAQSLFVNIGPFICKRLPVPADNEPHPSVVQDPGQNPNNHAQQLLDLEVSTEERRATSEANEFKRQHDFRHAQSQRRGEFKRLRMDWDSRVGKLLVQLQEHFIEGTAAREQAFNKAEEARERVFREGQTARDEMWSGARQEILTDCYGLGQARVDETEKWAGKGERLFDRQTTTLAKTAKLQQLRFERLTRRASQAYS